MSPRLQIGVLGNLEILLDGARLQSLHSRKAEALLVYLACTAIAHPRETLADLLWEERSQAQSLANLRVVLNRLKGPLAPFVDVTPRTIGLHVGSYELDTAEFDSWFNATQTQQLLPS